MDNTDIETIRKLAKMEQRVEDIDKKIDANQYATLEKFNEISKKLDSMENNMDRNFVSKHEFLPVKRIVYGTIGTVGAFILIGLIAKILGW